MRISFTLFGSDPQTSRDVVTEADRVGIEAVWFSDHLVTPVQFEPRYPYTPDGRPGYDHTLALHDVWTTIGHLSALTTRIKFGTGVYLLPLRRPLDVALALATASRISDGRVMLGVGSGWLREEYAATGADFDTRGARLDEELDIATGLLNGSPFEFHGEYFEFDAVAIGGPPAPDVPVLFGGQSPAALGRLARRGDGWFGTVCDLKESLAIRARVDKLRARGPRADLPVIYYPRLVGGLDRGNVRRYEDAGFDHVVVTGAPLFSGSTSRAERLEAVQMLGALAG